MLADKEGFHAAGAALGGCLSYLRDVLLDKQVRCALHSARPPICAPVLEHFGTQNEHLWALMNPCLLLLAMAQVLCAGRVELLAEAFGVGAAGKSGGGGGPAFTSLDGSALENLEVGGSRRLQVEGRGGPDRLPARAVAGH